LKFKAKSLASSLVAFSIVMAHAPYGVLAYQNTTNEQRQQSVEIEIGNTSGLQDMEGGQATFNFEHGRVSVSGDGLAYDTDVRDDGHGHMVTHHFLYTTSGSLTFHAWSTDNNGNYTPYVWNNGQESVIGNEGYTITNLESKQQNPQANYRLDFAFEDRQENQQFDGNAYFFWVGEGNKLCYHRFTGMLGNGGENVNYYEVSELTDQSGNNIPYIWGQEKANWALARDVEQEPEVIKPNLSITDVFGNGTEENRGCQLDPCGAENGANTISTNGDRSFKATIYRAGQYEGLTFGTTEEDYTYFPDFWDPTFFNSTIDISKTTAQNPAVYTTCLLEPKIKFRTGSHSKSPIRSVKALDVNDGAVEITRNQGEGYFSVKFNSNFYDKVTFELEDEQGEKYYVILARATITAHDNFAPDMQGAKVTASLYYPETESYTDYEVVATICTADGTTKTPAVLKASKIEERDVEIYENGYSAHAGKGLRRSSYVVDLSKYGTTGQEVSRNVKGIYFTAIKKGALQGNTYGGTFSGSGKGTFYSVPRREMVYNEERGEELA